MHLVLTFSYFGAPYFALITERPNVDQPLKTFCLWKSCVQYLSKHCFSIFPNQPFHRKRSETDQNIVPSLIHLLLGHLGHTQFHKGWHQSMKNRQLTQPNNDLIFMVLSPRFVNFVWANAILHRYQHII